MKECCALRRREFGGCGASPEFRAGKGILNSHPQDDLAGIQFLTQDHRVAGLRCGREDQRIPERHLIQDGTIDGLMDECRRNLDALEYRESFQDALGGQRFDTELARRRHKELPHHLR
jgi:hypothetical protein